MISKRLFFIATLCIVNVSVYTINDSEYDTDGLSIYANAVNEELGNTDLNLNGNFEESFMENARETQDSANLPNEGRIRICSSSICNRVCRVLKLKGKCVKKRCKCTPKGGFITADTANDEFQNDGMNVKEDMEESQIGVVGLNLYSAELTSEDRISNGKCHSNICNNECRILNLKGTCVSKRCMCLPRVRSILDAPNLMYDEEVENSNFITDE